MVPGIEIFIRNQFGLFNRNFIDSVSGEAGDFIHDFRIAAKRIKMISDFVQWLTGNSDMDPMFRSSGIRRAFKSAGRYREISLNRQLLAESEILTKSKYMTLRKELRLLEKVSKQNYLKIWNTFPYTGFYKFEFEILRNLSALTMERFTDKLEKYIGKSLSSIGKLVSSGEAGRKLHVARKEIKKIKYGLEWNSLSYGSFGTFSFNHKEITLIEDKIGEWHDWLVFNRFLDEIYNRNIVRDKRKRIRYEPLKVVAAKRLSGSERTSVRLIRKYFELKS